MQPFRAPSRPFTLKKLPISALGVIRPFTVGSEGSASTQTSGRSAELSIIVIVPTMLGARVECVELRAVDEVVSVPADLFVAPRQLTLPSEAPNTRIKAR